MKPYLLCLLFLSSCATHEDEFSKWKEQEIQELLQEDKENKELELIYLEEIRIAQENEDNDAYEYFFQEYIEVPRLDIPEELKQHPDYFQGGQRVKY